MKILFGVGLLLSFAWVTFALTPRECNELRQCFDCQAYCGDTHYFNTTLGQCTSNWNNIKQAACPIDEMDVLVMVPSILVYLLMLFLSLLPLPWLCWRDCFIRSKSNVCRDCGCKHHTDSCVVSKPKNHKCLGCDHTCHNRLHVCDKTCQHTTFTLESYQTQEKVPTGRMLTGRRMAPVQRTRTVTDWVDEPTTVTDYVWTSEYNSMYTGGVKTYSKPVQKTVTKRVAKDRTEHYTSMEWTTEDEPEYEWQEVTKQRAIPQHSTAPCSCTQCRCSICVQTVAPCGCKQCKCGRCKWSSIGHKIMWLILVYYALIVTIVALWTMAMNEVFARGLVVFTGLLPTSRKVSLISGSVLGGSVLFTCLACTGLIRQCIKHCTHPTFYQPSFEEELDVGESSALLT